MSAVPLAADTGEQVRPVRLLDASGAVVGDPTASTGGLAVVEKGGYNTTPPTVTNGQYPVMQTDAQGRQLVYVSTLFAGEDLTNNVLGVVTKTIANATYSPLWSESTATLLTLVKAAPGNLKSFVGTNANAAKRYLQFHNVTSTGAVTAGRVAEFWWPVPLTGNAIVGTDILTDNGLFFSTGIVAAWSTTATTYTAATAADHDTGAIYV